MNEAKLNPLAAAACDEVAKLLAASVGPASHDDAILLEIACGRGLLATRHALSNTTYVGVDSDPDLRPLVEAHGGEFAEADLALPGEQVAARLREIVGGRRVHAIVFLGGLAKLTMPGAVLGAIRDVAHAHGAPVIVGVPNVAHRDIGLKLVMGRWDYTEEGLLANGSTRFYTQQSLENTLSTHGLHVVARSDVIAEGSDQSFPPSHPLLQKRTTIRTFLDMVRQGADTQSAVGHFVWLCHSGPQYASAPVPSARDVFLSVLIRTRGRRLHELRETLLCLLAQSVDDFEVLLLLHNVGESVRAAVDGLLAEFPVQLTSHIRVVAVHGGTRARPLNVGFAQAAGRYVAVLDDDDHVMAHWVETFRNLEEEASGRLIRARCATQESEVLEVRGRSASSSTRGLEFPYDAEFALLTHLIYNQTPFMSVAFPRGVFDHLGLRFDESLSTTEDWDFLLRSASLIGVADSLEITAIYRRWANSPASHTDHRLGEWVSNRSAIDRKMDLQPILLPPGEARVLRERILAPPAPPGPSRDRIDLESIRARERAMHEVLALMGSRSWLLTSPLRALGVIAGQPRIRLRDVLLLDEDGLVGVAAQIRSSLSWRFARSLSRRRTPATGA